MTSGVYTTRIWGETYKIKARWDQASSSVDYWGDSDWQCTGRQVADYAHSPREAMREHLLGSAEDCGPDTDEVAEIDAALDAADAEYYS